MKKLGIQETKDAVLFACRLADAVDKSMADDKITVFDAKNFMDVVPTIKPAFEGGKFIGKEVADLDEQERIELDTLIAQELDFENDDVEGDAEESLEIFTRIVALVSKIRNRRAKNTAQESSTSV
jgi:replicative superfamily II helicase